MRKIKAEGCPIIFEMADYKVQPLLINAQTGEIFPNKIKKGEESPVILCLWAKKPTLIDIPQEIKDSFGDNMPKIPRSGGVKISMKVLHGKKGLLPVRVHFYEGENRHIALAEGKGVSKSHNNPIWISYPVEDAMIVLNVQIGEWNKAHIDLKIPVFIRVKN